MSKYVLIESTEPARDGAPGGLYDIAGELAALGHEVTLFLVQNAVLGTRRGAVGGAALQAAAAAGVQIRADEFSLRERGIRADRLAEHVQPQSLDTVVDALAAGCKALWH